MIEFDKEGQKPDEKIAGVGGGKGDGASGEKVYLVTTGDGSDGDEWDVVAIEKTRIGAVVAKKRHDEEHPYSESKIEEWPLENSGQEITGFIDAKDDPELLKLYETLKEFSEAKLEAKKLMGNIYNFDKPDDKYTPLSKEENIWAERIGTVIGLLIAVLVYWFLWHRIYEETGFFTATGVIVVLFFVGLLLNASKTPVISHIKNRFKIFWSSL